MISTLASWLFSFILKIVDWFLSLIFSTILGIFPGGGINFASVVTNATTYVQSFYGLCIQGFMIVRNILDINRFEMSLIVETLSVAILYKPLAIGIKIVISWIRSLKQKEVLWVFI